MPQAIVLSIPEKIMFGAKIPRPRLNIELKKELALQLYREEILSFANARRLAGMNKVNFHFLLGERKIPRQYDVDDFEEDMGNLAKWSAQQ